MPNQQLPIRLRALRSYRRAMISMVMSGALGSGALGSLGCSARTEYTPRTPGKAALGVERGELGVYKSQALVQPSTGMPALFACSPAAQASSAAASEHFGSYKSNVAVSAVMYGVGAFVPVLIGVGAYFGARANAERQEAQLRLVDAVNQHNDDSRCTAEAASAARKAQ
jgi:hypothetical protein